MPASRSIVCRSRCEARPSVSTQRIRFRRPRIYAVTSTCEPRYAKAESHRPSSTTGRIDTRRAASSESRARFRYAYLLSGFQPPRAEESRHIQMLSPPAMINPNTLAHIGTK